MVHGIGTVSRIIVIVIIIFIMDHHCVAITAAVITAMVIMITVINTYCHNSKSCMIGRIITVRIGRIIGYVNR